MRRLLPFHANLGKRLVKSPKIYVRDSGLLHALLDISDHNELAGHPVAGASWEGAFVVYPGEERYPISETTEVVSLHEMCMILAGQ